MDEGAGFEPTDLRHHQREQRIGSDIKRDTQEKIGTALVELAAQFAVLHKELKQSMTWRKGHPIDLAHVPSADDVTPTIRVLADLLDDLVDLVDRTPIGRAPIAPLRAIDSP